MILFHNELTINTLNFILEQVLVFLTGKQRNETQACLSFLMIFIKILPQPYVLNHLKVIVSRKRKNYYYYLIKFRSIYR